MGARCLVRLVVGDRLPDAWKVLGRTSIGAFIGWPVCWWEAELRSLGVISFAGGSPVSLGERRLNKGLEVHPRGYLHVKRHSRKHGCVWDYEWRKYAASACLQQQSAEPIRELCTYRASGSSYGDGGR